MSVVTATISSPLLTRSQSAELAGVTVETISKYEEIGLLAPIEQNGELMYREGDIRSLFYTREFGTGAPFHSDFSVSPNEIELKTTVADAPPLHLVPPVSQAAPAGDPPAGGPAGQINASEGSELKSLSEILRDTPVTDRPVTNSPVADSPAPEMLTADLQGADLQGADLQGTVLQGTGPQTAGLPAGASPNAEAAAAESKARFQVEVAAVKMEAASAENRALRDQIELLREERDWLRKRVEQLEVRSEREQMLLLSENETVRRLVDNSKKKWSIPFRLPWFSDSQ